MYGTLALTHRALDDLTDSAGAETLDELRRLARPIEGLRVLNLSVSGFGTGTAELLNSSVPLFADLGLECHWQVVRASEDASTVTRAMYRALGGTEVLWTHGMTETWLGYAAMNAELLTERFDVIIVHDPQPAAIRSFVDGQHGAKWIMHSHLDLSSAQEDVWLLLKGHVDAYDAAVFEAPRFARTDIVPPTHVIRPAIDPNSARNMPLPDEVVRTVLTRHGIDAERRLICQVSPCDIASDLFGAIEAWEEVRRGIPELQLVLVLTTEPQDPGARACYDDLARRCNDEPSLFVLSMGNELGNVELNVFQRAAAVVIQKGLRKGYGLWVSDALWKRRPCVVAPAGGLEEQVIDGHTGLVAATTNDFAQAILRLIEDPGLAARLADNGRSHVAEKFLITRYLADYLVLLNHVNRGT